MIENVGDGWRWNASGGRSSSGMRMAIAWATKLQPVQEGKRMSKMKEFENAKEKGRRSRGGESQRCSKVVIMQQFEMKRCKILLFVDGGRRSIPDAFFAGRKDFAKVFRGPGVMLLFWGDPH